MTFSSSSSFSCHSRNLRFSSDATSSASRAPLFVDALHLRLEQPQQVLRVHRLLLCREMQVRRVRGPLGVVGRQGICRHVVVEFVRVAPPQPAA